MRRIIPTLLFSLTACAPLVTNRAEPIPTKPWDLAEQVVKAGRVREVHFPISGPPVFTLNDSSRFLSIPPNGMKMKELTPIIESLSPSKGKIRFTTEWPG